MKKNILKKDLSVLLDPHFKSDMTLEEYEIRWLEPTELLTWSRLDLAIKILYLECKKYGPTFYAAELYSEHIKAFSMGSYSEPGNRNKNSLQKYLDDFEVISTSIASAGLDDTVSVIPLSESGSIANGAHRVAASYVAERTVPVVQLACPNHEYDARFFIQRGMSQSDVEIAVTKFIELASNCYVALVWPSAEGKDNDLESLFPNILYNKNVELNHTGAHNLLSQVYYDESWLGERAENFPGVQNKLVECFKTFKDLRVIAFQADNLQQVLLLKEKIRTLYSIGKHSVHITDTQPEAIRVARILFNDNSIHFLNHGQPNKYFSTHEKLERFKQFVALKNLNVEKVVLDSSVILSLYGLRECNDIDYLLVEGGDGDIVDETIQNHIDDLKFHGQDLESLVLNPSFYFYYDDMKFVAFSQLLSMKKNRSEEKDLNDVEMMTALLQKNRLRHVIATVKQKYYFLRVKLKLNAMLILRHVGLYNLARMIYRKLKQ